jgi:hypothetical protein
LCGALCAAKSRTPENDPRHEHYASPRLDPSDDFFVRVLSESPIPELEMPEEGAPQRPRSNGLGKPGDLDGESEG